ncbi:uncharacterized protein LOC130807556 [Amaranthus tricolor]|uniref:uncharacterized protein LOC130807556 n=1 Tax=Amaranthus tricolor TaxID=29722 RepID=UPI0025839F0C|nr:uncharacterized protein LOC130807556 [Amaranthus tricolor]
MNNQSDQSLQHPYENLQAIVDDLNLKHPNSLEIVKSSIKIITSNTKYMFILILSILPFFLFMVILETNIREVKIDISEFLIPFSYPNNDDYLLDAYSSSQDMNQPKRDCFRILLEFFPFHLILLPLFEIISLPIILNVSAKINAGQIESTTLKEIINESIIKLKGLINTFVWVYFHSTLTLIALGLILVHHFQTAPADFWLNMVSITVHSVLFLGFLYKFLYWSSIWNLGMVITFIEDCSGIAALDRSERYAKQGKKIEFQLMFSVLVFYIVLRLPYMYDGLFDEDYAGVSITCIVMISISLGNLVKWVAFLLSYYYCKKQYREKKVEDQQGMMVFKIRQVFSNLQELKSFEILISALKIFTSNIKFMLFIVCCILPLYIFMVFSEIKLQEAIDYALSNSTKDFIPAILKLCLFYVFLYPILECVSICYTIKIAEKLHVGEKQVTIKHILNQKLSLKCPFITYLYVYFQSSVTFLGLLGVLGNYKIFSFISYYSYLEYVEIGLNILSISFHSMIFFGLLYKYLEWSAIWNLGMVISVMEEQNGIAVLGISDYYGKKCKKTGFELMLVFFLTGNVLRVFCLYGGLCNGSFAGVLITCVNIMLFLLANLVKWITFLLYYYHCKQQIMEKKVDDQELGVKLESTGVLS